MNFANVTSLTIPEGSVKAIYCNDVKLWGTAGTYENTITGVPPLTLANCTGDDLVSWSIVGNTIQDGTPSPENPVDVQGVGDWDETEQKYKIPVVTMEKNLFSPMQEYTIQTYKYFKFTEKDETYTLSVKLKEGKTIPTGLYFGFSENGDYSATNITKWLIKNGVIQDVYITNESSRGKIKYIAIFRNTFDVNEYFDVQLELGSTPTPYEPYTEPTTTNIYLNSPLMTGETMSSDGTITRASGETESFTPPSIPTQSGTTVLDTDCVVAPSEMTVTFMSTTPQNEETR